MKISEELFARLKELASQEVAEHDDLFGETPDDAYAKGVCDGETLLAQHILEAVSA